MTQYDWGGVRAAGERPDAGALDAGCRAYFDHCAEENREPTRPGLMLWLGITTEQWDKWCAAKSGRSGQRGAVLKRAAAVISDSLQQRRDTMAVQLVKLESAGEKQGGESRREQLKIRVIFGEEGE